MPDADAGDAGDETRIGKAICGAIFEQHFAFGQRFADQAELIVFEVA